ncbi:MAG: helix-turn-helix protein [Moraxellaceae bacterium]|jgi:AraC-like DNA-binding protein|nr:helix-turn-helix protein [Moraxellaceae bacterium]
MAVADKKLIIGAMLTRTAPRSISSIQTMAGFGTSRGLSLRDCLAGTGLRPGDLDDPVMTVSIDQEFAVIRNLLRLLGDTPGLGLMVGERYHFTSLGSVGFALASSPSMYHALGLALRYFDLTFAITAFHLEEEGEQCRLVITDPDVPPDLHRFALERAIGVLHMLARSLFGQKEISGDLHFSFPAPPDVQLYEDILGVRPHFGAPRTVITFAAGFLKQPLPHANAMALHQAEEQCRKLLAERNARRGLAERVFDRLARRGGNPPTMQDMAEELRLSVRTLRRRLQEEGATYLELCDEVRRTFAEELLALPQLTVEQIAERLGYSEAAGFIHAFKRWTGKTPHAFRLAGRRQDDPDA